MILDNAVFSEEVPASGATKGHVRFHLKSRQPEDVALVGFCANVTASLLFERLQAQGTNIVVQLGKEDRVDVLARYENDGLNLLWTPKPADANQLNETAERIKNKTFFIGKEAKEAEQEKAEAQSTPIVQSAHDQEHMTEEEEDHQVKQLHRIP